MMQLAAFYPLPDSIMYKRSIETTSKSCTYTVYEYIKSALKIRQKVQKKIREITFFSEKEKLCKNSWKKCWFNHEKFL